MYFCSQFMFYHKGSRKITYNSCGHVSDFLTPPPPYGKKLFLRTMQIVCFSQFFRNAYQKIQNDLKHSIWRRKKFNQKTKSFQHSRPSCSPLQIADGINVLRHLMTQTGPNKYILQCIFFIKIHMFPF